MRREVCRIFCIALASVGIALFASAPAPAAAGTNDVWRGGAWSSTAGWLMMNCVSDATQNPPCQSSNYGVTIASVPNGNGRYDVTGWAWSANVGWVCFGGTCAGAGITPEGGAPYAEVEPVANIVHGWANILSLGVRGWLSLNCADLVGGCTTYAVTADRSSGLVTGFGWNGNGDGTGIGWVDFSPTTLLKAESLCADGLDNDSDSAADCADPDCAGKIGPGGCTCGAEDTSLTCTDTCDNDGDTLLNCADPTSCKGLVPECPAIETACQSGNCCGNLVDDDLDGLTDCSDQDCWGVGACASTEPFIPGNPPSCDGSDPVLCCSDIYDNDLDGPYDCQDSDCVPYCTGKCSVTTSQRCIIDQHCPLGETCEPTYFPWLQSLLSDIYAKGKIEAAYPPPTPPLTAAPRYNATFCLLSAISQVTKFFSDPSGQCTAPPQVGAVNAPSAATGYATALGRIDVAGILAGRYGSVVGPPAASFLAGGQDTLLGRVYYDPTAAAMTIGGAGTVTFLNGSGMGSGAGLVVVRGDLTVSGNVLYEQGAGIAKVKNLASAGFLVLKRPDGTGGNIFVAPSVTSIAGAYFAENSFDTGTGLNPLTVYGPVVAKSFQFRRTYVDPNRGSEQVIYDARTRLNPPPGLVDFAKGLPVFSLGSP